MRKKVNASNVYSIAKVITVLLVVIAHSTRMYTSGGAFSTLLKSDFLAKLTDYIYIFHMPLFIFLSGSVYGLCIQRGKYAKKLNFLLNKAKRLLIPYFVFGFFFVAPVMCLTGLTEQNYFLYCLEGIVLSLNSRHLWFLVALFIIFVYSTVIRKWILKSHGSRAAVLVVSVVIAAISNFLPYEFQLRAACSYQLYFVMGAIFHLYFDRIAAAFEKISYLWFLFPLILLGSFYFNPYGMLGYVYRFVGILMILILSVLINKWTKLDETRWFLRIKDYSMGIFLFHPMIIYVGYYWLGDRRIPPIILSSVIAIVATLLSVVLTKVLRKLKLSVLMGE